MRAIQRDVVDQQELHRFKDAEKNKALSRMFERLTQLSDDIEEANKIERLRRKVTHDLEHQINDLLALRDTLAAQVDLKV